MNWKCWFFHQWKDSGYQLLGVSLWKSGEKLIRCERCGKGYYYNLGVYRVDLSKKRTDEIMKEGEMHRLYVSMSGLAGKLSEDVR